jgi:hypothetical protein
LCNRVERGQVVRRASICRHSNPVQPGVAIMRTMMVGNLKEET